MATASEQLADLPHDEATVIAREMVAAESRLSGEDLSAMARARIQSWCSMETHRARRVVSLYTDAAEELDEASYQRIRNATQDAMAKLEPAARSRLQSLAPELFEHAWRERWEEEVGGRSADRHDAHIGTPVYSHDEQLVGHVERAEGKYVAVAPEDGDPYWLSVSVIRHASDEGVALELDQGEIDEFALRDEAQLKAGLDAPDPTTESRVDPRGTDEQKEARREGLVRDDDGSPRE